MNQSQQSKFQLITAPAAIANNTSPATTSIDTQGYDYAEVFVILGATDIALTALKIQESDTDGSYGDVTGLVYGTSASIAGTTASLPSATDDNKCFKFEIDLRGRKRYLDLVYTIGNGTTGAFSTAFVLLSRAKDHPVSASERGFGNIVRLP